MKNAIDLLIDKIKETNNPTVMGLDPRYEMLPECIKSKYGTEVKCTATVKSDVDLIKVIYINKNTVTPLIGAYVIDWKGDIIWKLLKKYHRTTLI